MGEMTKIKRLFKFRYPKIALFFVCVLIAYVVFSRPEVSDFLSGIGNGYIFTFIGGLLFSFGFTTPFAIGFFIDANPSNLFFAAIIGGFGAMISDLLIFHFIRFSFMDEFRKLERTKVMRVVENEFHRKIFKRIRAYLIFVIAGFIIASPLPDEMGVALLAGFSRINPNALMIISFVFNSIGIFVMLLI